MDDQAGAERAIKALDGGSIDDRAISVRIAEDKRGANPTIIPRDRMDDRGAYQCHRNR